MNLQPAGGPLDVVQFACKCAAHSSHRQYRPCECASAMAPAPAFSIQLGSFVKSWLIQFRRHSVSVAQHVPYTCVYLICVHHFACMYARAQTRSCAIHLQHWIDATTFRAYTEEMAFTAPSRAGQADAAARGIGFVLSRWVQACKACVRGSFWLTVFEGREGRLGGGGWGVGVHLLLVFCEFYLPRLTIVQLDAQSHPSTPFTG